jgi:xanthine dehydrogenase accessory factor
MSAKLYSVLQAWLERGRACALATVVESRGSVPRPAGAKMLIAEDGSTEGSVGGGALELEVVRISPEIIRSGEARLLSYRLDADLGMACGGSARVFIEPLLPPPPLYVFGAGHVGRALCSLAASLGFAVTVIDERIELASPEQLPNATAFVHSYDPSDWGDLALNERAFCVVATPTHATDFAVVRALMKHTPRYVGMIGSKIKRRRAEQEMSEAGLPPERLAELHTPTGLPIGAITPEEIAVSIAAELIQVRRRATGDESHKE